MVANSKPEWLICSFVSFFFFLSREVVMSCFFELTGTRTVYADAGADADAGCCSAAVQKQDDEAKIVGRKQRGGLERPPEFNSTRAAVGLGLRLVNILFPETFTSNVKLKASLCQVLLLLLLPASTRKRGMQLCSL